MRDVLPIVVPARLHSYIRDIHFANGSSRGSVCHGTFLPRSAACCAPYSDAH